jgi:SAM-dependent methyltransferase
MVEPRIYKFVDLPHCLMCTAPSSGARVVGMRLNRSQGGNPRQVTGIGVTICRCGQCGMNFPQPLPVPNHISDHYGIPPESYWKEAYFKTDPGYFKKQIDDAKRLLGERSGMTALDIGAGIGKAMIAMTAAGFDCYGIEPGEPFRAKAIARMGIPEERIQLAALEDASFAPGQFDFITFGAVLEHLYDPAASIEKALGWLKPGGVIQIEVPSSDHLMMYFLNFYYRLRGTNYVTNLSPMHSPFHLYTFTRKSFETHAARAGYEIAYSYIDVASIRHVPGFLKPMLHAWMAATDRGQQLTVWLRKKT